MSRSPAVRFFRIFLISDDRQQSKAISFTSRNTYRLRVPGEHDSGVKGVLRSKICNIAPNSNRQGVKSTDGHDFIIDFSLNFY